MGQPDDDRDHPRRGWQLYRREADKTLWCGKYLPAGGMAYYGEAGERSVTGRPGDWLLTRHPLPDRGNAEHMETVTDAELQAGYTRLGRAGEPLPPGA